MEVARRTSRLGTESAIRTFVRAQELRARGRDIVNLALGAPDFPTPPHIVEAGRRALAEGHHFYTEPKGIPALREAIADDLRARHGARVDPGHVLVTAGAKPLAFFVMMMLAEPGAEVILTDPGYPQFASLVSFTGATPVLVPTRPELGHVPDPDELLARIGPATRLLVLNSPSNPTGAVLGRAAMDRLVEGLLAHPRVAVLSDEIYGRLVYEGEHVGVLAYEALRDRAIVVDGFSKTYSMTGWRLGWGVFPSALIELAERMQINALSCAAAFTQIAAVAALRGPQEPVDAMREELRRRRDLVVGELSRIPGVTCRRPAGAFFAFPEVRRTGLDSRALEHVLLEEAGVATSAGASFGPAGEGHLRISYAASEATLREGLRRMRSALEILDRDGGDR